MNKEKNNGYFTNSKMKITATEEKRTIEFEIPEEETKNVTAGLIKINHQKGLYDEFFTLNQQFLSYVLKLGLSGKDWEVFVWLMSVMDYGNKILVNQDTIMRNTGLSQSQVSRALSKFRKNRIIVENKLDTAKYELGFNYDLILNPQMAFKGKATKENIKEHKELINNKSPYYSIMNIDGDWDLVNAQTGEIFRTVKGTTATKSISYGENNTEAESNT